MNGNNENFQNQDPIFNMEPKKSPWGDIFLGLGLAILLIASIIISFYSGSTGVFSIIMFILISAATLLAVKLIKQKHPIAGKILLAIIIPLTLLLLLFGACFAMLGVL